MSRLEIVKQLRFQTGLGLNEILKALDACDDDPEKAKKWLRENLKVKINDAADATEGTIGVYHHHNGQVAAMVLLSCNTDFTARNDNFTQLAKDLAMHIASANPQYISMENIPDLVLESEKEILRNISRNEGKPEKILDKIIEGRIRKFYEETCLLEQVFVKDPSKKIKDMIKEIAAQTGEAVSVKRITRFQVGA